MGITGLLPFLKEVLIPVNIKDYQGCTVGRLQKIPRLIS